MPVKCYYWEEPCHQHEFERPNLLLIGISILNQLFAVVIHENEGITSLADWEARFAIPRSTIWSSGEKIPISVLLKNIHNTKNRQSHNPNIRMVRYNNKPVVEWHQELHLYRFCLDGYYCVRHEADHDVMANIYSAYL